MVREQRIFWVLQCQQRDAIEDLERSGERSKVSISMSLTEKQSNRHSESRGATYRGAMVVGIKLLQIALRRYLPYVLLSGITSLSPFFVDNTYVLLLTCRCRKCT